MVVQEATHPRTGEVKARVVALLVFSAVTFGLIAFFAYSLESSGFVSDKSEAVEIFVSLNLFVAQDGAVASVTALLLVAGCLLFHRDTAPARGRSLDEMAMKPAIWLLPVIAFGAAMALRVSVHHGFDLSLDEFMPAFQADIFRSGRLLAALPPDAFELRKMFQPFFIYADEMHGLWASHYRPFHAALLTVFTPTLLNPLTAALSVWAIMDIARRLFPARSEIPLLAGLLLLVSPQFLLTASSGFSFSAHLGLNLLWLALFLRGSISAHIGAALIGFVAIGLHQVHVHPLFAAPFLAALLLGLYGSRWMTVPYIVSYAIALPLWMAWPEVAVFLQTGDTSVLPRTVFEIDYVRNYLEFRETGALVTVTNTPMLGLINVSRFLLWVSPILLPLSLIALLSVRTLDRTVVLAGLSFLLTVVASHILMPNQMQSWGSRYYHPVLGCYVLFALGGYVAMRDAGLGQSLRTLIVGSVVASLIVFLPWRALQVDAKVGPRAEVQAAIEAIDADVVVIPTRQIWFGFDYVRNRPDLSNRPLIITDQDVEALKFFEGMNVIRLTPDDFPRLGLPTGTYIEPG